MTLSDQRLWAFFAGLMAEGVTPDQIEKAVARARDIRPGQSIAEMAGQVAPLLVRAFIFEQAARLEKP